MKHRSVSPVSPHGCAVREKGLLRLFFTHLPQLSPGEEPQVGSQGSTPGIIRGTGVPSFGASIAWLRRHREAVGSAVTLLRLYPNLIRDDCLSPMWDFMSPYLEACSKPCSGCSGSQRNTQDTNRYSGKSSLGESKDAARHRSREPLGVGHAKNPVRGGVIREKSVPRVKESRPPVLSKHTTHNSEKRRLRRSSSADDGDVMKMKTPLIRVSSLGNPAPPKDPESPSAEISVPVTRSSSLLAVETPDNGSSGYRAGSPSDAETVTTASLPTTPLLPPIQTLRLDDKPAPLSRQDSGCSELSRDTHEQEIRQERDHIIERMHSPDECRTTYMLWRGRNALPELVMWPLHEGESRRISYIPSDTESDISLPLDIAVRGDLSSKTPSLDDSSGPDKTTKGEA